MDESILNAIKKFIGLPVDEEAFDTSLIMTANTVFAILTDIGYGPKEGFEINSSEQKWSDFIQETDKRFNSVKSYVCLKTQMIFDTPTNSYKKEAMEQVLNELEWRIYSIKNYESEEGETDDGNDS